MNKDEFLQEKDRLLEAQSRLVDAVRGIPGVEIETDNRERPSIIVTDTRMALGKEGRNYIRVMKRKSRYSEQMRDDFHEISTDPVALGNDALLAAIRTFRNEIQASLGGERELVNPRENANVTDHVERELKTAVYFDLLSAADRTEPLVAAMRRLSDTLRR